MFVANRKTSSIIRAVAGLNQLMGWQGLSGASSFLADGGLLPVKYQIVKTVSFSLHN